MSVVSLSPGNVTTALQNALNAGDIVEFTGGSGAVYTVDSEITGSGVVQMSAHCPAILRANNTMASVLKLDSVTGGYIDNLTVDGDSIATHTVKINDTEHFAFKRSGAMRAAQYNIYPTGTVDRLTFDDFLCTLAGSDGFFADNLNLTRMRARNFRAVQNGGEGIVIKQNIGYEVFDNKFEDLECTDNDGKGIETLGTPERMVIDGFVGSGNGSTPISLSAGKYSTISGFDIDAGEHTAIELASTYGITIEPGGFIRNCRVGFLVAGSTPQKFHKIIGTHIENFTHRAVDNRAEGTIIIGNSFNAELGHIADPIGIYNAAKKLRAAFNVMQDCDYDIFLDGGANADEWSVNNNTGINTQNTGIRVVGSGTLHKCIAFGNSFPDAGKAMDTASTITWGYGNRLRVAPDVIKGSYPSYSFKAGAIIDCTSMTGNNPYV